MTDVVKSTTVKTVSHKQNSSKHTEAAKPTWHAGYLRILPAIRRQALRRLWRLRGEARADALQEIIADTVVVFARLSELGKDDQVHPTAIVNFAVAKFHAGRRVGNKMNVRDLMSRYCQQQKRIVVERLNHFKETGDEWQEILVEDQHASPAEVAAIRIDFREWLKSLPLRTCQIARLLATGESTSNVAQMFAVSASRISQLRRSLRISWLSFVGEGPRVVR
jgi:hypothetical protein